MTESPGRRRDPRRRTARVHDDGIHKSDGRTHTTVSSRAIKKRKKVTPRKTKKTTTTTKKSQNSAPLGLGPVSKVDAENSFPPPPPPSSPPRLAEEKERRRLRSPSWNETTPLRSAWRTHEKHLFPPWKQKRTDHQNKKKGFGDHYNTPPRYQRHATVSSRASRLCWERTEDRLCAFLLGVPTEASPKEKKWWWSCEETFAEALLSLRFLYCAEFHF